MADGAGAPRKPGLVPGPAHETARRRLTAALARRRGSRGDSAELPAVWLPRLTRPARLFPYGRVVCCLM